MSELSAYKPTDRPADLQRSIARFCLLAVPLAHRLVKRMRMVGVRSVSCSSWTQETSSWHVRCSALQLWRRDLSRLKDRSPLILCIHYGRDVHGWRCSDVCTFFTIARFTIPVFNCKSTSQKLNLILKTISRLKTHEFATRT
jgi:hypothetical protein